MKRDLDVIRRLLLWAEASPARGRSIEGFRMDGCSEADMLEHARLAHETGLIEAKFLGRDLCHVHRLTWEGHEFLRAYRNDTGWIRIKRLAIDAGLPLTLEVMKDLVPEVLRKMAGMR